jgi:hypothetical protein
MSIIILRDTQSERRENERERRKRARKHRELTSEWPAWARRAGG